MPRSNSRMTAAVNSSSSCVHLPFRKGAFSRCAATRAAAVVALPLGLDGTIGRSPLAAAAAADASAAVVGFSSMRDISAAARAASMIVGAGPCRSQARVAQTGSAGSPPRGALRVRAGGVSVSSGAGRSTLGNRAGEFAPLVDCGLELPVRFKVEFGVPWRSGSRVLASFGAVAFQVAASTFRAPERGTVLCRGVPALVPAEGALR